MRLNQPSTHLPSDALVIDIPAELTEISSPRRASGSEIERHLHQAAEGVLAVGMAPVRAIILAGKLTGYALALHLLSPPLWFAAHITLPASIGLIAATAISIGAWEGLRGGTRAIFELGASAVAACRPSSTGAFDSTHEAILDSAGTAREH